MKPYLIHGIAVCLFILMPGKGIGQWGEEGTSGRRSTFDQGNVTGEKPEPLTSLLKVNIFSGYSRMTAKIQGTYTEDVHNYIKRLKNGYHWGADISLFTFEGFSVGVHYNNYRSEGALEVEAIDSVQGATIGLMKDNISVNYLGGYFSNTSQHIGGRFRWEKQIGLGWTGFFDRGVLNDQELIVRGNTPGVYLATSWDLVIVPSLTIGAQAGFMWAVYFELIKNGRKVLVAPNKNISRLDLSVSLKYYL
jgi:hypothetical protein